jgi:hypothetical protein
LCTEQLNCVLVWHSTQEVPWDAVDVLIMYGAGEQLGWRFLKFHMLKHIIHHIILFGWWENCSCQVGESCHKFWLKLLKSLTNNKVDWEQTIFKIHRREQSLRHILAEIGTGLHSLMPAYAVCVLIIVVYRGPAEGGR